MTNHQQVQRIEAVILKTDRQPRQINNKLVKPNYVIDFTNKTK